jgi:hypothetical protein
MVRIRAHKGLRDGLESDAKLWFFARHGAQVFCCSWKLATDWWLYHSQCWYLCENKPTGLNVLDVSRIWLCMSITQLGE